MTDVPHGTDNAGHPGHGSDGTSLGDAVRRAATLPGTVTVRPAAGGALRRHAVVRRRQQRIGLLVAVPLLVVGVRLAANVGGDSADRRTTGTAGTTGTETSTSDGRPAPTAGTTSGPRPLGVPIELRPVLSEDTTTGPCASPSADRLDAPGGSGCLTLGPARMTIRALASLGIGPATTSQGVLDPTQETIDLTLTDADARDFATLTAGMLGQRLAVVVDGAVLTAPTIAGVIESGQLQIPGPTAVLRPVVVALTR